MILCHEYRFIFIKTHKTAGTSIEIALSKFCGPRDVITPIQPPEDEQMRRDLGYPGPQNTLIPPGRYLASDWWTLLSGRGRARFFNHIKARAIRQYVGRDIWEDYYKFSVDRNPWDAAISRYYWKIRDQADPISFSEFLKSDTRGRAWSNFSFYAIDKQVVVDHVMRYEDLDAELGRLQERLKLPDKPVLPHAKSGVRRDRRHYSELISPPERDFIAQACAREIELFGYRFEPEKAGSATSEQSR